MTSTLWRYVEQLGVQLPMVGLVTVHPHNLPDDHDPAAPCKYFIESPAFRAQFGCVAEVESIRCLAALLFKGQKEDHSVPLR